MTPRPCLTCGRLTPSGTRCPDCERPRARATQRAKRLVRPYTAAEKRRRADAVDQWRQQFGDWCPGWQREAHPSLDLTADHVVPVAAGGIESGPLRVICRQCNSARGARP
jgi:5-methylcytosine-specific restriction protein A